MDPYLRILVNGLVAYAALVLFLRLTGKRTLSKLNAFDLVITIALGSTFAAILTSPTLPLAQGLVALLLLVLLQYVVTFTAVRSPRFSNLLRSRATRLLADGSADRQALRRERIAIDELESAVRAAGGASLSDAEAVHIESDGSLTARLRTGATG